MEQTQRQILGRNDPEPAAAGLPSAARQGLLSPHRSNGFTLLELLVVLGIIGILAAVSLPAMRGLGQSNSMDTAVRQLVDDLTLARARAMSARTVYHVVFVPPEIGSWNFRGDEVRDAAERLLDGPYRTYGFYAERTLGDQPGRPFSRYADEWKTLPNGIIIATREFDPSKWPTTDEVNFPLERVFIPFPLDDGSTNDIYSVPHIAFGPEGTLVNANLEPVFIPQYIELAKGSVMPWKDSGDQLHYDVQDFAPTDPTDPSIVRIRIDGFTGKVQVVKPTLQ